MPRRWQPDGAVAIVTGASSGIGRCLCELLLEQGCHVVAVARRADRLAELQDFVRDRVADGRPGALHPVVGDVTADSTLIRALEAAGRVRGGAIDLLVNNAGIGAIGPFMEASPERLRQVMEVNFFAPAEWTRRCVPALRLGRAPVICNISSVLGHRAVPGKSEYCASKFAMHGLSDSIRAELRGDGIQVTLVSPSTTRSEFFDVALDNHRDTPEHRDTPADRGGPGSRESGDGKSASARRPGGGERLRSWLGWSPRRVAQAALAAIRKRRGEVILSAGGKLLVYADRVSPPAVNALLAATYRPRRGLT